MESIFYDIGLIMITATVIAFLAKLIKQPIIPAYVITGILLGPVFKVITNQDVIQTLSEIGIAFLLFVVGIEIEFKRLKEVGLAATLGGLVEVLVMFIVGYFAGAAVGMTPIQSVYIGLLVAFSSTMVVVKILSDIRELDTLHGRIVLGILLVQDVLAVFAMSTLVTLASFSSFVLFLALLKGILLVLIVLAASHYIFPFVFKVAAKSSELLFLTSITACFLFALLFSVLDFSIAIGAFAAGIAIANLPYSFEIVGKVKSIRDFFATLFFVALGMQLTPTAIKETLPALFLIGLLVVVVKPVLIMVLTSLTGYKKRVAFATGMALAQTSEFALILIAIGMSIGHVGDKVFAITVITTITTISITSYLFKYSHKLYNILEKPLSLLDRISKTGEDLEYIPKRKLDVLLIGLDRTGYSIFRKLQTMQKEFIIVDYNPNIIRHLINERVPCIYGDISNPEIMSQIDLKNLKLIISTVPDEDVSEYIIKHARRANKDVIIFVTAYQVDDALLLYEKGADYVILPHFLGGEHVSLLLEDITKDINSLIKTKLNHIRELHNRHLLGHEHPAHRDHSKKNSV
ncbi:hypothetical protein D6764_00600 [Candidatus Woesearchaeota archaeon]|nr:MAG: hypothetical protein D6764_00600 [Candidatus Woesearchaeota archaeon]